MTEEIKKAMEIINDIYFILKGLEEKESGDNVDYQGVIDDLEWNRHVLNNRLIDLRRKEQ